MYRINAARSANNLHREGRIITYKQLYHQQLQVSVMIYLGALATNFICIFAVYGIFQLWQNMGDSLFKASLGAYVLTVIALILFNINYLACFTNRMYNGSVIISVQELNLLWEELKKDDGSVFLVAVRTDMGCCYKFGKKSFNPTISVDENEDELKLIPPPFGCGWALINIDGEVVCQNEGSRTFMDDQLWKEMKNHEDETYTVRSALSFNLAGKIENNSYRRKVLFNILTVLTSILCLGGFYFMFIVSLVNRYQLRLNKRITL